MENKAAERVSSLFSSLSLSLSLSSLSLSLFSVYVCVCVCVCVCVPPQIQTTLLTKPRYSICGAI